MKKVVIIASSKDKESKVFEIANSLMETRGNVKYVLIDPVSYRVHLSNGASNILSLGCKQIEKDNDEDINHIKEHMLSSDLMLVISPVCSDNIHGALKSMLAKISDWLKLFKLANKPIHLITTSEDEDSGHVLDNLDTTFSAFGASVLLKENFMNEITNGDFDKKIKKIKREIEKVLSIDVLNLRPNDTQEGLYSIYKEMILLYPKDNEEYVYWKKSGLLTCTNLSEYFDNISSKSYF